MGIPEFGAFASKAATCNLYCIATNQKAIIDLARAMRDQAGNVPPLPGVFPGYLRAAATQCAEQCLSFASGLAECTNSRSRFDPDRRNLASVQRRTTILKDRGASPHDWGCVADVASLTRHYSDVFVRLVAIACCAPCHTIRQNWQTVE